MKEFKQSKNTKEIIPRIDTESGVDRRQNGKMF